MRVNKVSFTGIKINAKDNKEVKFLYNKVLDVVRDEHIPATFRPYDIEINTKNSKIKKILEELRIKFKNDNEH